MKKWLIIILVGFFLFYVFGNKKKIKNFPNSNLTIVAFGDSLTAGYGAPKGHAYPDYLTQRIERPVVNLGLSGELAVDAPRRLPDVLAQKPYMVLIEFGGNDFMQQRSRMAAVEAVAQIVEQVQASGAIAVIVDIGGPGMEHYTRSYRKLAKEKQALFVPAILQGIFNKRHLKADRVHPNSEGYKIVADKIYNEIKPYLK